MKIIYSFMSHVGLGDNIRGLIFLKQVQANMNFELYIDFNGYPIENFLIYKNDLPNPDLTECFPAMDNELHHEEVIRFINHFSHLNCIQITTNWKPHLYLTDAIKQYMRDILQLRPEYEEYLNQKVSQIHPNYKLFHYRFGDEHICNKDNLNIEYYAHLMHHKKENTVLISDSLLFKEKCKKIVHVFLNDPIHTTSNPNYKQSRMDELILDTICDFYLIKYASAVYSYSCLPWLSNFVQWTSNIYDIPLYDLR
jgi:hypothetical protein